MNSANHASKFFLFFVMSLFCLATVSAQNKTITGKVTIMEHTVNPVFGNSSSNESFRAGTKVCAVGIENKCVETDGDGKYSIEVPTTVNELIFSLKPDYNNPNPSITVTIPENGILNATIHWNISH
jgi:hypothetical protein